MWAAGQALAAALRAKAPRRFAQRALAQRLAAALAPTLCDVWGVRWASMGADGGAAAPPGGEGAETRLGGAGWQGGAGSGVGAGAVHGLGGQAGGEAAQAAPFARKQRARHSGTHGEKTADGRPKPDERTVAYLVALGWFATEEEVVAVLTRAENRVSRYAFETAKPAADWLEATLGREPVKKGALSPGAKVVKWYPALLCRDAVALQRKWGALRLPSEQGGVGIGFSEEQARKAVCKHPQILSYAEDNLACGWSMLTVTERGMGLSPEEARGRVLLNPQVLSIDIDKLLKRVELLRDLGYADARRIVLAATSLLSSDDKTVKEHAAWWEQTELDHVKIITTQPNLLGAPQTAELQAKLDFLRRVAGMSTEELNNAGSLFHRSLDGRLRARYFYALLKGRLARFGSMNTMMKETDATFLAMLQGGSCSERASDLEVARYQKLVASAKFAAWRQRREALLIRGAPEPAR